VNSSELIKLVKEVEVRARRVVKQDMLGLYLSAFRGTGMQFREFRNYVYGDDVRHISWSVSARAQDPVIKTFEEERERTLFLIVDVSASLRKGPWGQAKSKRLAEIAASLSVSAMNAQDQFGLLMYSDRVERVVPPAKGRTQLLRVIRDILAFEPQGRGTDPNLALKQIDQVLKKQSLVFLLSDLEVLPDEKILKRTSMQHEFAAFIVEDPREWNIPDWGFIEVESSEKALPATIDSHSATLRKYISQHYQTRRQASQELFRKAGADLLSLYVNEDYALALRKYFEQKARRVS
jgi:uncharacterized protein (DUF58 family)